MKRIGQMRRTALERGIPMVFLGESSGARIPDNMGAYNMGAILGNDGSQYQRTREQPWTSGYTRHGLWFRDLVRLLVRLQRYAEGRHHGGLL